MAARLNPLKHLQRQQEIASIQVDKLIDTQARVSQLLSDNNLSKADTKFYKDSVRASKKMITAFGNASNVALPSEPPLEKAIEAAPRRRGRPPKEVVAEAAPKRRGRPPGSKNAAKKAAPEKAAAPKRRGRPPGSKNKAAAKEEVSTAPKRRGRPPGSKNKPKAEAA